MNEVSLLESLGQVSASETGQIFRDFLRGHVREMICEVMAAEVTQLCGPKHAPSAGDHYRAGSAQGRAIYEGEREELVRPRVRRDSGDGHSEEVELSMPRGGKFPPPAYLQIAGQQEHDKDNQNQSAKAADEDILQQRGNDQH